MNRTIVETNRTPKLDAIGGYLAQIASANGIEPINDAERVLNQSTTEARIQNLVKYLETERFAIAAEIVQIITAYGCVSVEGLTIPNIARAVLQLARNFEQDLNKRYLTNYSDFIEKILYM